MVWFVPSKITVPEFALNVPEFDQSPFTFQLEEPALTVPALLKPPVLTVLEKVAVPLLIVRIPSLVVSPRAPLNVIAPAAAVSDKFCAPLMVLLKIMLPPLESIEAVPPDNVVTPNVNPSKPDQVRPSSCT